MKRETGRLLLTLITEDDLNDIHRLHSLPEVDRFNTLGIPDSINDTKAITDGWITQHTAPDIRNFTFAIRLREGGSFIGLIALNLRASKYSCGEVWYKLFKEYWSKDYATEALEEILSFGFSELALHRIEAGCAVENTGSVRVLEKAGMTLEGRKRKALPLKTGWSDTYEYGILAEDIL